MTVNELITKEIVPVIVVLIKRIEELEEKQKKDRKSSKPLLLYRFAYYSTASSSNHLFSKVTKNTK